MTARWDDPPSRDDDPSAAARGIIHGLVASLVLWALIVAGVRTCAGQVEPVITFDANHRASSLIRNSSRDVMAVTVELRGPLPALDTVRALVAPTVFTLHPSETQTIKIRLRDVVAPGTVLRLRSCFTPVVAPASDPTVVRAVILLRTCIISKVITQ